MSQGLGQKNAGRSWKNAASIFSCGGRLWKFPSWIFHHGFDGGRWALGLN